MKEVTIYVSDFGQEFRSKEECEQSEIYIRDLTERLKQNSAESKLEKLILDLNKCLEYSMDRRIVDTIGSVDARAIKGFTNVCKTFYEEHKNYLEYY